MKDIVDILKEAGYGVVEGEKAVRAKIAELADNKKSCDVYLDCNSKAASRGWLPHIAFPQR